MTRLAPVEELAPLKRGLFFSGDKGKETVMLDGTPRKPNMRVVTDVTNVTNVTDVSDGAKCHSMSPKCHSESSNVTVEEPPSTVYNLAAEVRNFVDNSIGSFTVHELDTYLGLDRSQAKNRNKVLSRLCNKNIIIRISNGRYERANEELEKISLFNVKTNPFEVSLPLGLDELVSMPKKSIMVIAGTANAGKTQFALELVRMNLERNYRIAYLMSEMGQSEYVSRVRRVCNNDMTVLKQWDSKVHASERSSGFPPVIAQYCPEGLGVIDYLEAPEGDYSMIVNEIKRIYDRITEGMVCIAMQKAFNAGFARGGEGTLEKARLFLSMEQIKEVDNGSLVAIKILKAKTPKNGNVNGKELHVMMSFMDGIIPLSDWQWVKDEKERKRLFDIYDTETDLDRKIRMEVDTVAF